MRISFLESLSPLDECKKSFVKMIMGVLLGVTSLLIFYFGRESQFGYLESNTGVALLFAIPLMLLGSLLFSSYIRCVVEFNRKRGLL